jgi:hypothetical protein
MAIRFVLEGNDCESRCRLPIEAHLKKDSISKMPPHTFSYVGNIPERNTDHSAGNNSPADTVSNKEPDAQRELDIGIYPNPAADYFIINIPSTYSNTQLMIFDAAGDLVKNERMINREEKYSTEGLVNGPYIIRLSSGSGWVRFLRLIVAK